MELVDVHLVRISDYFTQIRGCTAIRHGLRDDVQHLAELIVWEAVDLARELPLLVE